MQTVSVTVPMNAEGAKVLSTLAAVIAGGATVQTAQAVAKTASAPAAATEESAAPKKRGRKPKAQAAQDDDLNFGEPEAEGDELGLDEPAYTLEGDIIPAFRNFITRHNGDKAKAGKILEAHGVKSVRDLPAEKFGEVMAALSK